MSGGGGGTTQTVQKADPWAGQQPYLLDIFEQAKKRFGSNNPQYFPQSTVAPQSAATLQGQQGALDLSKGILPQVGQSAAAGTLFDLGPGRDVATNPYLQSAINAAMNPVLTRFGEAGGPLSQIRSNAIGASSEGTSSRQGIAEGIALRGLGQQLTDMSSTMAFGGYQQAQDQALKQTAMLPQTMQSIAYPSTLMSQVGQQQDAYTQSLLADRIARWNFQQNLPQAKLQDYAAMIQGQYGGTTAGSMTAPSTNPLLAAGGGALGGYALANMIPAMGIAGPWGAGIGAALALLSR